MGAVGNRNTPFLYALHYSYRQKQGFGKGLWKILWGRPGQSPRLVSGVPSASIRLNSRAKITTAAAASTDSARNWA